MMSLDAAWDTLSWPQRFMECSFDVNYTLMGGTPDLQGGLHWSPSDVRAFVAWAGRHCDRLAQPTRLYRGTTNCVPYFLSKEGREPAQPMPGVSRTFLSTTMDRQIAKEFTGSRKPSDFDAGRAPGYVHVLHLQPGCRVIDMGPHYTGPVRREKEVVLLPGAVFTPGRRYKRFMHWTVTAPSNKTW